jgi:hypothetical protein
MLGYLPFYIEYGKKEHFWEDFVVILMIIGRNLLYSNDQGQIVRLTAGWRNYAERFGKHH